jgi:hypothetical protein
LPWAQLSIVEYLELLLTPVVREVLANCLQPNLDAQRNRLTLGYSRNYDTQASERPAKEFLVVRQQEKILGIQPINDGTVWRAALAEQNDVIDLISLFLQLPQHCERKIFIEKDSHPSFLPPAVSAPPRERRNGELR